MLKIIVVTMLIVLLSNILLKKINLPTIIGYIATGVIIAFAFGLHDAADNETLKEIGEFGVVFLMFTIGLEFSLMHLRRMKNEVFLVGSLQIIATTAIFYLLCYYVIGLSSKASFVLGMAISLSSTAIVLKTFNETGEITKRYGQKALGILIMQDIAVIPILLIIGFLSNPQGDMEKIILHMILSGVILLALLWLIGKYLLERLFQQIIKTNSDELFTGMILFLAIGSSYLSYVLGFSYSLGAFIGGMLIAETKYKHQAQATLTPFRDLLLGVFFITVGMQINLEVIYKYIHFLVLLLAAVIAIKFIVIYLISRLKDSSRISLKTALSLVQIGEFSLVILEIARSSAIIQPPYGQIFIVTIAISMIITPLILKNLTQIADFLLKDKEIITNVDIKNTLVNHIVLIGFGEFGNNIAKILKQRGEKYIALEYDIDTFNSAENRYEPVIFGNAVKKEVLKDTHLESSKAVIIAINNLKKLIATIIAVREFVEDERIFVKVHNKEQEKIISGLGIKNITVENSLTSNEIINSVILPH